MKEWRNITLKTLIEADKVSKEEGDPLEIQVRIIALITGKSEDEVWDMPKARLHKLLNEYQKLGLPKEQKVKDFKAGKWYWRPEMDISKFSGGQYMDCIELVKDKDKIIERLPDLLATICEPYYNYPLFIKRKPKLSFEEKRAMLLEARAEDVYPLSLFFCRVLIHLTKDTVSSLEEMAKNLKNQKTHSVSNGDGT